jgi:NitT/TauT family transport system substrate-binding protein
MVGKEGEVTKRMRLAGLVLALLVSSLAVGLGGAFGRSSASLTQVKVAVFPAADYAPLFVGIKRGVFKKAGLDIKVQYAYTGSALMAAITSGAADLATNSDLGGITGIANGLPVKIVTQTSFTPTKGYLEVLVRGDSSIKNFGDLAGKTVATINLQGQFHLLVANAVEKAGGDPNSVRAVPMSPADEPAALASGRLDAIVMQDPTLTQAKLKYPTFRSLGNPVGLLGYKLPSAAFYSSLSTIQKKAAIFRRFRTAYKEAAAIATRNQTLSRQTVLKYTGIDNQTALKVTLPEFTTVLTPKSLGAVLLHMKRYGFLKTIPSFSEIYWSGK